MVFIYPIYDDLVFAFRSFVGSEGWVWFFEVVTNFVQIMATLTERLDEFLANPYINKTELNETLLKGILKDASLEVINAESQYQALKDQYDKSKDDHEKLKQEKKGLDEKGGKSRRSIQEEMRLTQVAKEIKSAKLRYKRQGNKMRKMQRFSSFIIEKFEKLLLIFNDNQSITNRLHFLFIAFCIQSLERLQNKFAEKHRNIELIYNYLLENKDQTKPLLTSMLKWIHSYNDNPINIISIFNDNSSKSQMDQDEDDNDNDEDMKDSNDHNKNKNKMDNDKVQNNLWILYIICCAFPALFITITINMLQNKKSLSILLHHLLPKYPVITLKMINTCLEQKDMDKLKMTLKIAQFHPKLWAKLQKQQFTKKIFDSLLSSLNDKKNEDEMQLLFGFENLMMDIKDKDNGALKTKFTSHISDIILNLNDFDKYINHNIDTKYSPISNDNYHKGSVMLSLCNKFQRLKQCNFDILMKHNQIIKLLCLMDHAFFFNVIIKLIIDQNDIKDSFKIFEQNKQQNIFYDWIKDDIDVITYHSLKKRYQSNKSIKNLHFILKKLKLTFNINSHLLSALLPLLQRIDIDTINLLYYINTKTIPKNVGILLSKHLFTNLLQTNDKTIQNAIIHLIIKLCENDNRISKEGIELCVSYILCPELNGEKITKLKAKEIPKDEHNKLLRPKTRINPYADALLKQIDKENIDKFEALRKIIQQKEDKSNKKKKIKSHAIDDKNDNDKLVLCWSLLLSLQQHFIPYLSQFIESLLPGIHLQPSLSRYTESVQKGTVLMFDHDVFVIFESFPDLLLLIKMFCITTKLNKKTSNPTHYSMLCYLRSLSVSYYIKCMKYTKTLRAIGDDNMENKIKDYDFYNNCMVIFECIYLCDKTSLRFEKIIGLLFDLELNEIGKLFRHICSLCLQPQHNIQQARNPPTFPAFINDKMLEAEKRVIRQILLSNTSLMSKHIRFVASILSMTLINKHQQEQQ